MTIAEFLSTQSPERQDLLSKIHIIIIQEDESVDSKIGKMMGQEMILYNAPGTFKYGLASTKNYMSLHALPLYVSPEIHSKYKNLLPDASFQKGCINFIDEKEMPLTIVEMLIADCSKIDLLAIRAEQLKSRKK